jgi:hypothetical protein
MIYLIGIVHDFQYVSSLRKDVSPDDKPKQFRRYLLDLAARYSPTLIAEEFNEAFRSILNLKEVIGESVASELGIDHQYCDPIQGEKGVLGLTGVHNKYYPPEPRVDLEDWSPEAKYELIRDYVRREKKWFKALSTKLPHHVNIFFVCGADHFRTFKTRLCRKRTGQNRLKVKTILHSNFPGKGLPYWKA